MTIRKVLKAKTMIIWVLVLASGILLSAFTALASESGIADLCSFIPLEKAAAILSLSEDDLQKSHRELQVSPEDLQNNTYKQPPLSCSIRSKSNFLKMITYVVYIFNDPSHTALELKRMKEGYGTVSEIKDINDMGEEAFWVADARFQRLVARKDNKVIDILNPKEFQHQADIMQIIMDQL